ncbi:MAG: hypothetical protein ACE5NJ_07235, partial [Thermodesulfobacteriota bacterium]
MIQIVGRDDLKTLGDITYFEAPPLKALGVVNHVFCTRSGGVSRKSYPSAALGDGGGDERTPVLSNRDLVVKTF